MQNAIRAILDGIPSGNIFDSHYVIGQLIKGHTDTYLSFAYSCNSGNPTHMSTLSFHGKIGQEIVTFAGTLIQQLGHESWSENIHGNSSPCTCWKKL